ncbi:hypothetical protein BGZ83_004188 [Gryganskiella cystojenkinii]|nr:hypothetical protein BGZ83_004188 [Gryganskiella cystojenkinii]
MAVALQPKKKLKNRSRQRSSSRAYEEEDEDMAIVSRLEKEPWQPDLLLERRSDNSARSSPVQKSSSSSTSVPTILAGEALEELSTTTATATADGNFNSNAMTTGGFQGVIPMIIKSPASVITNADSDCVDSIFEDFAPKKISGIQEYLQQTHDEQEQQRQHQQELQLQYQLPTHLLQKKQQQQQKQQQREEELKQTQEQQHQQSYQRQLQYRNSFHGEPTPFLHLEEQERQKQQQTHQQSQRQQHPAHEQLRMVTPSFASPRPSSSYEPRLSEMLRSESPLSKTTGDNEDVIDSLQSLKNIAMLALDSLLQQVVSAVTASDPVYNPDETTIKARAILRETLSPPPVTDGLFVQSQEPVQTQSADLSARTQANTPSLARYSISQTPISGMAASSFERLDELARKVDQLTVVVSEDSYSYPSQQRDVLHEPLVVTNQPQSSSSLSEAQPVTSTAAATSSAATMTATRIDQAQIFESQEYQLACTLAALLACIYKILNRMQGSRVPIRTESADSGLDQASRLWKRLSSNSFGRIGNSHSIKHSLASAPGLSHHSNNLFGEASTTTTKKQAAASIHGGTNGWMESINRQVRTLRSRRTQSTSHIEVSDRSFDAGKRPSRLFGLGSSKSALAGPHSPEAALSQNERELERDWNDLDILMEEMSQHWRAVEGLGEGDEGNEINGHESHALVVGLEDEEASTNPFHDRHQLQETSRQRTARDTFDQQTLDMVAGEDLPGYDAAPQYRSDEKQEPNGHLSAQSPGGLRTYSLTQRISRGTLSGNGIEDEKTRFDLNNVMSAFERLCQVTPRLDNQRVQLSATQKRQMASADVAGTIEKLSQGRWEDQRAYSVGAARASMQVRQRYERQAQQQQDLEKTRDLNKLVSQIVDLSTNAGFKSQRAEFSPQQQWKLEGARIGDRIERSEKRRLSDQDWQSPETVLLRDMTRLTNALYQQSASTQAFATQRFTLTEDKARAMALNGIISKIERLSDRRLENQDALPPPIAKSKPFTLSPQQKTEQNQMQERKTRQNQLEDENLKAQELQEMMDQVVYGSGGPTRRSAIASQRAEFSPGQRV